MPDSIPWNDHYRDGNLPWDTGRPSTELQRVVSSGLLARHAIAPGPSDRTPNAPNPNAPLRALDIGCGTGSNTIWLAQQGFDATGIDVAPLAIEQARERARAAGVHAHFAVADVLNLPDLGEPFDFFFDRGCYHAVRRDAPDQYAPAVARRQAPRARGLILAGNAHEPHTPGPPVVTEEQLRAELGTAFDILELQEFRFDEAPGVPFRFLGWSCLVEKR